MKYRARFIEGIAWPVTVVAWSLSLFCGCGFDAGSPAFDDQHLQDGEHNQQNTVNGSEVGGGDGAGTMAGTWLKLHVASSCVLGQEQVSAAYYLVEIETEGVALREQRRLCGLELSPLLGFRPVASRAVLESVEFPMVDHGLVSSLLPGAHYGSSTVVGLWGIDLDDPIADPVPTDPDDEAVVDADGDGNPGVTMELEGSGCERYMGQRQIVKFYGSLVAPNDVVGSSVRTTETVVYGASGAVCELAPDVRANDDHSIFRMVRVDGLGGSVQAGDDSEGRITCSDIEQFYGRILEVREPNDDNCS